MYGLLCCPLSAVRTAVCRSAVRARTYRSTLRDPLLGFSFLASAQRLRTRGVVIHFVVVVVVFARWVEAAEAFLRRKRPPVLELQELVVRDDMRHVVARIADGVHEPLLNAAWAELSHGAA